MGLQIAKIKECQKWRIYSILLALSSFVNVMMIDLIICAIATYCNILIHSIQVEWISYISLITIVPLSKPAIAPPPPRRELGMLTHVNLYFRLIVRMTKSTIHLNVLLLCIIIIHTSTFLYKKVYFNCRSSFYRSEQQLCRYYHQLILIIDNLKTQFYLLSSTYIRFDKLYNILLCLCAVKLGHMCTSVKNMYTKLLSINHLLPARHSQLGGYLVELIYIYT